MADVELLRLPRWMEAYRIPGDDFHTDPNQYLSDRMREYARTNLAPLQAEIERLRAEVDHRDSIIATHAADTRVYQKRIRKAEAEIEQLQTKTAVTMGVGTGDGNLFVHGDYESIKAAQALVLQQDELRAGVEKWKLQSEDWQKKGWQLGSALDEAEARAERLAKALRPFVGATLTTTGQVIGLMREDFDNARAVLDQENQDG